MTQTHEAPHPDSLAAPALPDSTLRTLMEQRDQAERRYERAVQRSLAMADRLGAAEARLDDAVARAAQATAERDRIAARYRRLRAALDAQGLALCECCEALGECPCRYHHVEGPVCPETGDVPEATLCLAHERWVELER